LVAGPIVGSPSKLITPVRDSLAVRTIDDVAPYWLATVPGELTAPLREMALEEPGWSKSETAVSVTPPDRQVLEGPLIAHLRHTVLRVRDFTPGCGMNQTGSGFVIGAERVMTNAHVVAGATDIAVDTADGPLKAEVVQFDPSMDIAVLAVPGLTAPPLPVAPGPAQPGADAVVLGYPGGGAYTAAAARVRSRLDRPVPDIYRASATERRTYAVTAAVQKGNSGGPLVDTEGRAFGIVFGLDENDDTIGYAADLTKVLDRLNNAWLSDKAVSTGSCLTQSS
jgi:S1-C subfamily serine protease